MSKRKPGQSVADVIADTPEYEQSLAEGNLRDDMSADVAGADEQGVPYDMSHIPPELLAKAGEIADQESNRNWNLGDAALETGDMAYRMAAGLGTPAVLGESLLKQLGIKTGPNPARNVAKSLGKLLEGFVHTPGQLYDATKEKGIDDAVTDAVNGGMASGIAEGHRVLSNPLVEIPRDPGSTIMAILAGAGLLGDVGPALGAEAEEGLSLAGRNKPKQIELIPKPKKNPKPGGSEIDLENEEKVAPQDRPRTNSDEENPTGLEEGDAGYEGAGSAGSSRNKDFPYRRKNGEVAEYSPEEREAIKKLTQQLDQEEAFKRGDKSGPDELEEAFQRGDKSGPEDHEPAFQRKDKSGPQDESEQFQRGPKSGLTDQEPQFQPTPKSKGPKGSAGTGGTTGSQRNSDFPYLADLEDKEMSYNSAERAEIKRQSRQDELADDLEQKKADKRLRDYIDSPTPHPPKKPTEGTYKVVKRAPSSRSGATRKEINDARQKHGLEPLPAEPEVPVDQELDRQIQDYMESGNYKPKRPLGPEGDRPEGHKPDSSTTPPVSEARRPGPAVARPVSGEHLRSNQGPLKDLAQRLAQKQSAPAGLVDRTIGKSQDLINRARRLLEGDIPKPYDSFNLLLEAKQALREPIIKGLVTPAEAERLKAYEARIDKDLAAAKQAKDKGNASLGISKPLGFDPLPKKDIPKKVIPKPAGPKPVPPKKKP